MLRPRRGLSPTSNSLRPTLRDRVRRISVFACVAAAVLLGATRLQSVLGLYDYRADRNASLGYLERLYGDEGVVGSRHVVEDGASRMPEDVSYRVIVGPHMTGVDRFTPLIAADFLRYFLFPRRQVESGSARWILCYGCDVKALGPRFRVLSDGGNGILFGHIDT